MNAVKARPLTTGGIAKGSTTKRRAMARPRRRRCSAIASGMPMSNVMAVLHNAAVMVIFKRTSVSSVRNTAPMEPHGTRTASATMGVMR